MRLDLLVEVGDVPVPGKVVRRHYEIRVAIGDVALALTAPPHVKVNQKILPGAPA
jgi:hypothetical protein